MQLTTGQTFTIHATVRDALENPIDRLPVVWSTTDALVATVTPHLTEPNTAIVRTLIAGVADIVATYGAFTDTTSLTVVDEPVPASVKTFIVSVQR